ncbi:alpha/beta hydrolase [Flavobacterium frigidarium]|mgnify:CR=1 FL=1|uniref:alpha/beta hydrolase n=1 Tax=Flavobacterium frigidarium TaxID=99286 RepID=UPI0030DA1800
MRYSFTILTLMSIFFLTGCSSKKIKDQSFMTSAVVDSVEAPKLNIFQPDDKSVAAPVLIFIHGGNWNSGNKDTYNLLGRNFAKKGVVTIIPDYTLSPKANYDDMAKEVAAAIKWVQANVKSFNGDANQIYVTGHSAGGHLAALAVMNPKYGIDEKSIAGIILNDAAGLDMKNYLEQYPPTTKDDYLATWTADPAKWRDASPIYFLNKNTPPFLIYVGDKTYPSITVANDRFLKALKPFQPSVELIHIDKKHVPMVTQYFWPYSDRFDETLDFINKNKK